MRLTIDRDTFVQGMNWAAHGIPQGRTAAIPILGMIRIIADGDRVTFTGFDYETAAQATVTAATVEGGAAYLPGRLGVEVARSLPAGPVELTCDAGRTVLTCGKARFTLMGATAETAGDYPAPPAMPPPAGVIPAEVFTAAVAQVATAAGREGTLPQLTGVQVEANGDHVTLAATDRYRLAVRELEWKPARDDVDTRVLIPARTLAAAAKTMPGTEVTVGLATHDNGEGMAGFSSDGWNMSTRLLSGEFPRYRALIPDPAKAVTVATVQTAAFTEAVKRVALVTVRDHPAVSITFTAAGEARLEAGTEDGATDLIEATVEGDDMTLRFNPHYLLDGLTAVAADAVEIRCTTPLKPAVLTPAGGQDAGFLYLLMPIR